MSNFGSTNWTPERKQQFLELWPQIDKPASVIAAILGGGLTRSAVLGHAHRMIAKGLIKPRGNNYMVAIPRSARSRPWDQLGISMRTYRRRVKAGLPLIEKQARIRRKPSSSIDLNELFSLEPAPEMPRIKFAEIKQNSCRWPLGNEAPYLFCGRAKYQRQSYCAHHCRAAFNYMPGSFHRAPA